GDFVRDITKVVIVSPAARGFIWLQDTLSINPQTAPFMGFGLIGNEGKFDVKSGLDAALTRSLNLRVQTGMLLTLKGTLLEMGGDADPQILFAGSSSPVASTVTSGVLPFSGPLRGCIQFAIFLQRLSLNDRLNWGFQFLIPDGGGGLFPTRSEYL